MFRRTRSWQRALRMIAAAGAGLVLVLAGASTAQAANTARLGLFVDSDGGCGGLDRIGVQVFGTLDPIFPNGVRITVELWGADTFSDDFRERWTFEELAFPNPPNYTVQRCVQLSTLDEDLGQDEVYAKVFVNNRGSGGRVSLRTQEISASF
jgi:hypothetical protein